MSTNNICFYKETDKGIRAVILNTTILLDYVFIRVCEILRSNMVH